MERETGFVTEMGLERTTLTQSVRQDGFISSWILELVTMIGTVVTVMGTMTQP